MAQTFTLKDMIGHALLSAEQVEAKYHSDNAIGDSEESGGVDAYGNSNNESDVMEIDDDDDVNGSNNKRKAVPDDTMVM